jgi:hypothetical protein
MAQGGRYMEIGATLTVLRNNGLIETEKASVQAGGRRCWAIRR